MKSSNSHLAAFLLLLATSPAPADVKLPAIFSDHMVLLQDSEIPVWGWAEPGEEVTVSVHATGGEDTPPLQTQKATALPDGSWRTKLAPLETNIPLSLRILGKNQITIEDVALGEVWLGSGQSNMAMTVSRALNFEAEKQMAVLPNLRMFREESGPSDTPTKEGKGKWTVCSPDTVGNFSATLYFFGREIHDALKTPVGLINSSVGGTPIESWIAPDAQRSSAELKPFFEAVANDRLTVVTEAALQTYQTELAKWKDAAKTARAQKAKIPPAPRNPAQVQSRKGNIGGLFNGKIAPIIPYAIRGALWYQGEANSTPTKAPFYEAQLRLLVTDWRGRWGSDFPFAWAQLPNFGGPGRDWPTIREAMLKTLVLPKTGMAINIDIGDEKNIHPRNKQEVGGRLSLWALGAVYNQPVPATSGPLSNSHEVKGSDVIVTFTHANGGLSAKGGDLKGFTIAGEDKQWKPASARIDGDKVIVSSPEVKVPAAVRYAWENFPDCNLYNGAGLPASPFRTDSWPAP